MFIYILDIIKRYLDLCVDMLTMYLKYINKYVNKIKICV